VRRFWRRRLLTRKNGWLPKSSTTGADSGSPAGREPQSRPTSVGVLAEAKPPWLSIRCDANRPSRKKSLRSPSGTASWSSSCAISGRSCESEMPEMAQTAPHQTPTCRAPSVLRVVRWHRALGTRDVGMCARAWQTFAARGVRSKHSLQADAPIAPRRAALGESCGARG